MRQHLTHLSTQAFSRFDFKTYRGRRALLAGRSVLFFSLVFRRLRQRSGRGRALLPKRGRPMEDNPDQVLDCSRGE